MSEQPPGSPEQIPDQTKLLIDSQALRELRNEIGIHKAIEYAQQVEKDLLQFIEYEIKPTALERAEQQHFELHDQLPDWQTRLREVRELIAEWERELYTDPDFD